MIRIAQPIIGPDEEAAVLEVLRSGRLVQGPTVAEFESAVAGYLGVPHAIAVSSGTAALIVALKAHGIGPGDEVLVPVFTFAATANAVLLVGATPVFVDVDPQTYNINCALLRQTLAPRTKAIIPVHLFGQACDMTALTEFAQQHGLIVIEDACQALGAKWQHRRVGTFATSCLSFYATKGITTGEGGMVLTNDPDIAQRARLLRNQGESQRYRTDVLAENYRMTEIAAALGTAQMSHADEWIECRRANAHWLTEHLEGVEAPAEAADAHHIYQQYTVRVPNGRRDALLAALQAQDIESAVYYPLCLHQQPVYQEKRIGGSFPVAETASTEVLSLPVHAALTPQDLASIAATVNAALAAVGANRA